MIIHEEHRANHNKILSAFHDLFEHAVFMVTVSSENYKLNYLTSSEKQLQWTKYYLQLYYKFSQKENGVKTAFVSVENIELHDKIADAVDHLEINRVFRYRGETINEYRLQNGLSVQIYTNRPEIIVYDAVNRKFALIAYPGSSHFQYEPVRIIRDILTRDYENDHFFQFHAGGFEYNGRGVLVCGRKGAGKSTTIFGLVDGGNASFIANDRVFIGRNGDHPTIIGIPFAAAIRYGTCFNSPSLRKWLRGELTPILGFREPLLTENYLESLNDAERWKIKTFIELTPEEIFWSMNTVIQPMSNLKYMLFPQVDETCHELTVTTPSKEWIYETLISENFTPLDKSYPDRFGLRKYTEKELEDQLRELIEFLTNNTTAIHIRYRDIYENREALYRRII